MTTQTIARTRSIWNDTRAIITTAEARTSRPVHTEQPRPAPKSQAEREAERWLAVMMFDHYNS